MPPRLLKGYSIYFYVFVIFLFVNTFVCAQTPISSATFNNVTTGLATSNYVATSPSDASGGISTSTPYRVNYGVTRNQFITDYTLGATLYDNFVLPDTLIIQRIDAGRQLIIFYEYGSLNTAPTPDEINLQPEQQTNEEALYQSGLSNAGYDNILVNDATNFANVERVDVIYYSGVVTSTPANAVFPIVERGGNDDIRVAAIRGLDANGVPNDYYPTVVRVRDDDGDWGNLGQTHVSLVLRRQDATSNPLPVQILGTQNLNGTAIGFDEFGVGANEIVYGYSIFADDVTATGSDLIDFSNATNFPRNTPSASGLDLIAGISTAVASDDNLRKATGPGGYKAALNTWLKANVGVTTATDAASVTDWQDQFLGDHDATTLGTAPTYRDGTASSLQDINFNPTIDFISATDRGLRIADNTDFNTAASYQRKSINIAFRTGDNVTVKQQIYEQGSNDRGLNVYVRNGDLYVGAWNETDDGSGTGSPWSFNAISAEVFTDTEYIISIEFDGNNTETGNVRAFLNGQSIGTLSNIGLLFSENDGIGIGDVNGQSRYDDGVTAAASFYGSIPEIIYCNEPAAFSSAQRNRIESYLAIKYGITLDQSTPINYVNSDGTVIFNTTVNASSGGFLEYNNDIAGIGRDDASEFIQLSSQSENVGSIVQMDRNTSIGTDDTWLIWGNDGGSLTPSRVVTKPDAINERLPRVWRVAEENSVGVTDVSFDLTGLGLGTNPDDFSLLIAGASSGADFTNATVLSGGTFSGDVITFTNVNLTDLQYFTLGTQFFICTPGNVQDGLSLWLKADAETYNTGTTLATNGQTVETWGDQSRNNFDAGVDTNRSPTWVENDVNFNPGLNFPDDGGSNEIGFNLGSNYIFAEDADGGLHVFSAIEPIDAGTDNTSRQQKMIYDFGDRFGASMGLGASTLRGSVLVPGDNNNFNISPNASEFILEGDFDISSGISDTHQFNIDGELVRTETFSFQLNDAAILQASTHGTNEGPVSIGRLSENNTINSNSGRRYFGDMQEIIVYNEEISDLEAQQVRSYLAIKYGVTLTNDNDADATINETISGSIQEGDYVASDGSTITFDYSDDTGFVTNIAGIGRDDDTCLEQKQSRSVNSDAILTIGLEEIAATNAANPNSFDDDLDFFTWGSDGASTAFANRTTDGTPGTVTERMLRVWRAQETGTVGATDISFDLTGLTGYSTDPNDYQLIIANGGDNTSLENGSTILGGTFNGTVLTFNDINLTDGQYFTLGIASEQCGPGGVTGNLQLWLRADRSTNTTVNAADITGWGDQSGNSFNASATNAPVYNENNLNFNPSIDFTASNSDNMQIADGTNQSPDQQAVFVVGSMGSGSDNWAPFVMKTASFDWPNGWGIARNDATTEVYYHKDNYSSNSSGVDYASRTITYDEPNIHIAFKDATNYNYNLNLGTTDTDLPGSTFQSSNNVIFLGASPSGTGSGNNTTPTAFLDGSISEVIMFSDDLTSTERQQIATYLAIKYGITLDQTSATDYLWSDGTTVIWDATTNAGYNNDIAGIGRDDISCFSQKQSRSLNSDDIVAIGLGTIESLNSDNINIFDDDGDYLIWGNDDGTTAQATAETSDVPLTISERMDRVWRVEDTGSVGETEIQFDLTGLGYGSNADDFRLMIASSGSGGTMSGATLVGGGTFNGSVLSFSGIDLADGEYFTLGVIAQCGPGGVNTNLALWLRADEEVFSDAGVTLANNAEDVIQWNDQTTNTRNASEIDAGGGAIVEPVFNTNIINYNPAIFISDQNTTNNSYFTTGAATNNVSGNMSLVAVFTTTQLQGTDNQIDNTPSLIGAEDNTASDDYGLGVYQGEVVFNAANTNTFTARSTSTYSDGEPYIATGTRVQAASGAVGLYVNSLNVGNGTSDATLLDEPDRWAIGNQKDYDNEAQFQGNIAEVIVFSSVLTGEEQSKVESYLALKYGITRTNDNDNDASTNEIISGSIREGDYVAADGGITWDYAARGATYFNDIAGIGRDDLSCFNQTHSKSENNDAIVDIEISSFPDDDSFLIWGNDNAAIEATRNTERPSGINSRLNREWQVQETGTVGSVSITFDLDDITGTPLGNNNLTLVRLMVDEDGDFSDANTLITPSSIDAINNTVTFTHDFTGGTGFYFTLGSEEVDALPIELLEFDVRAFKSTVHLKWITASEIDNSYFSIERSIDGYNFEEIGQLEGSGNSSGIVTYNFEDRRASVGKNYYRIKQVDFNGQFTYSSIKGVWVEGSTNYGLTIYPNPNSTGTLSINYSLPKESAEAQLTVVSTSGQIVIQKTISSSSETYSMPIEHLNSGIYFVRLNTANLTFTKRLIIK